MLTQTIGTGLSGVNCSEWNTDFDDALADSIASVSSGAIQQKNVDVVQCTDAQNRRRLVGGQLSSRAAEMLMARELRASQAVTLRVQVVMVLEESGIAGITPANAFTKLKTLLQTSVSSGALQTRMNTQLTEKLGARAPVLTVDSLTAEEADGGVDVTRSRAPTLLPTSQPEEFVLVLTDNLWFNISLAVVCLSVVLLVLLAVAVHRQRQGAKVLVRGSYMDNSDSKEGYSGFSNIQEEGKTPQKPLPHDNESLSRGSTKLFGQDNRVIPFENDFLSPAPGAAAASGHAAIEMETTTGSELNGNAAAGAAVVSERRKSLRSQHSELMIDQEEGITSFSEVREMMHIQEMGKKQKK